MVKKEKENNEEVKKTEEVVEIQVPVAAPVEALPQTPEVVPPEESPEILNWVPRTSLGRDVMEGKITSIEEISASGRKIMESEIVDKLLPGLKNELILIGGRKGKGGGKERTPVRITAKMHQSGRRFRVSSFVVVGNEDGFVGIGDRKS